jgi:hypothetical protein
MKSPQAGGCHACGGLMSQTLLYSLSCLGRIPIAVARWGELAGTETAGYLEDHYQLSFLEGRAEQFILCCVAASGGLSKAQTENKICKWTCYTRNKSNMTLIMETPPIITRQPSMMLYFQIKTCIILLTVNSALSQGPENVM